MVWVSVIRYQKCTFEEQKGGRDYDRKVKGEAGELVLWAV